MLKPKDILVVTTATIEGKRIKRHIKPVTAHLVAGTNFFSDILSSFSDTFGGRSESYQRQLTLLYKDAIDKIKVAAYEIGANAVVGLSIDMDEVSGKGKAMFMLTAIGTAVQTEEILVDEADEDVPDKYENVSADRMKALFKKKEILKKAEEGKLEYSEEAWGFIITNKVKEIFPYLLKRYYAGVASQPLNSENKAFYDKIVLYIDKFSESEKVELLYGALFTEAKSEVLSIIINTIRDMELLDIDRVKMLLGDNDFQKRKIALQVLVGNKPFYNKEDIAAFETLANSIQEFFKERGTRTTKKQLLSSKEKNVWLCECGKTNDTDTYTYCEICSNDISGFKEKEITPQKAILSLKTKVDLLTELIS